LRGGEASATDGEPFSGSVLSLPLLPGALAFFKAELEAGRLILDQPSLLPGQPAPFQQLIPLLLQALAVAALGASSGANRDDIAATAVAGEADAQDALEIIAEITERNALFFQPQLEPMAAALLAVASARALEQETRHEAIDCLLSIAEAAPAMCVHVDVFSKGLIGLALSMMLHVEGGADEGGEGGTSEQLLAWEEVRGSARPPCSPPARRALSPGWGRLRRVGVSAL
jgi:hypothetical protein